jgi:hypothetical protein
MTDSASNDRRELERLNVESGMAESRGDAEWLRGVIAPELVFQRANGAVTTAEGFLMKVAPSAPRETTIESVQLYGGRAVVTCVVTMPVEGVPKRFHNVRLWVRRPAGWVMLAWANEAVAGGQG